MPTELEQLLAVQAKDLDIRELQRKVDHLGSRQAQYRKQLDQLAARNRKRHDELEAKRVEAKRLSSEVDHLDEHIRNQEKKLENEIVSLKEMEAIKSSLDHGHQRIDQLEEQALALMDEVETEAEQLRVEDESFAKRKAQFDSEIAKAEAEAQAQRDRIDATRAERDALWAELPARLQRVYDRLQGMVDDPLAPLRGGECGGCKLQVGSQLVDQVRQGALVHCEHCSRLLYLP